MKGVPIREVDNALLEAASADQPASGCGAAGLRGGQAGCLQQVSCNLPLHDAVGSQQHGCGPAQHTGPDTLHALRGSPARLNKSRRGCRLIKPAASSPPGFAASPLCAVCAARRLSASPAGGTNQAEQEEPKAHLPAGPLCSIKLSIAGLSPGCRIGALRCRTCWLDQQGP